MLNQGEDNALSLFDGMSCAKLALDMAGIKYDNYFASEVDKHAVKFTTAKHPDIIHLGDVRNIDTSKLPKIKYLFGGSPCQSFSMAGKMKGMVTSCNIEITSLDQYLELKQSGFEFEGQSYLFWEYIRILKEVQPEFFLLENVKMTKKWQRVLTDAVGVPSIQINSALLTAQNRVRNYWINWRLNSQGLFGDKFVDIPQPKDEGILLKDILQSNVLEKYYLSEKAINYFHKTSGVNKLENITCIDANGREDANKIGAIIKTYGSGVEKYGSRPFIKINKKGEPKANQDKSDCFTAGGHSGGNHSDMDLIVKLKVIQLNPSLESQGIQPYQQNRIYDINGKNPALQAQLTTGSNNILIPEATTKGFTEIKPGECFDLENLTSKTRRGRKMEDKSNTVMAQKTEFMQYTTDYRIRRLTPIEVCRLQSVPDDYFFDNGKQMVSDSQIYKLCGNGWTVKVIAYLLNYSK